MAMTEAAGPELFRLVDLDPGLHLVATPIGSARDITLRALDTLASADVLLAEDTRVLRRLMEIHGVSRRGRPLLAYHDHNGAAQRPRVMGLLADGKSVAYASDAGTPLVADPGFQLARAAIEEGHAVHAVPGASASLAALSVAGLPTDRFLFAGFPPAGAGARATWLADLAKVDATIVLFEVGRRIPNLFSALMAQGQAERPVALCRELTKRYEEVLRGTVAGLAERLKEEVPRGELVLVMGPPIKQEVSESHVRDALLEALSDKPLKQAAADVASVTGWRKRDVYQLGLSLKTDR